MTLNVNSVIQSCFCQLKWSHFKNEKKTPKEIINANCQHGLICTCRERGIRGSHMQPDS